MREIVFAYIKKKYGTSPEYPWAKYDDNAVFRHRNNRKWFALAMKVGRDRLGLPGGGAVDVLNLKIDDGMFHDMLVQREGIFPAYHMNKEDWITVLLDGTVEAEMIYDLLAVSYVATMPKKKRPKAISG